MASQQAWDDFNALKSSAGYLEGELSGVVKDSINKMETLIGVVVVDAPRAAEVVALADTHPVWTSAHILDVYNRLLAVRAALIAQGF